MSDADAEQLARIQAAVRQVRRSRGRVDIEGRIRLAFDGGIVATCHACQLSWRVGRRQYRQLAWWSCPNGCSLHEGRTGGPSGPRPVSS